MYYSTLFPKKDHAVGFTSVLVRGLGNFCSKKILWRIVLRFNFDELCKGSIFNFFWEEEDAWCTVSILYLPPVEVLILGMPPLRKNKLDFSIFAIFFGLLLQFCADPREGSKGHRFRTFAIRELLSCHINCDPPTHGQLGSTLDGPWSTRGWNVNNDFFSPGRPKISELSRPGQKSVKCQLFLILFPLALDIGRTDQPSSPPYCSLNNSRCLIKNLTHPCGWGWSSRLLDPCTISLPRCLVQILWQSWKQNIL